MARHANDIADVQRAEQCVTFLAKLVLLDIDLQSPAAILEMKKRRLPHSSDRHDPAGGAEISWCGGDLLLTRPAVASNNFRRGVGRLEVIRVNHRPRLL